MTGHVCRQRGCIGDDVLRRPAPTRASSLRVFSKKQPRCCVFFVGDWKTRRLETQPGTWRVRLEFRVRWPHFAPRPISRRSSVRPCQRFFCEPARRVTVTGATEGWKVLVATAPAPRIRIFWLFSQLASPTHLLHQFPSRVSTFRLLQRVDTRSQVPWLPRCWPASHSRRCPGYLRAKSGMGSPPFSGLLLVAMSAAYSAHAVGVTTDIRPWVKLRFPVARYQTTLLHLLPLVFDVMDAHKHAVSTETSLLCQTATSPLCFLLLPVCPRESLLRMLGES